ncbi:glutathione S-transferase zeta class-like isoform X3 [Pyrus x bretschneideri]|uniref:glutathione S-transferase zeta class-like isoform X3 n=1 Tax=Pyrus x bretschneideri TaxID=225117 RepID=UPI0020300E5D|nr:glutathione S-transferase zeta class-like isoform X3 [Pyrus x bretschneideri]
MMEAQEVEVEAQAATESGDQQLKLYSYWRSSCAYRVRIALNLKEFRKLNPLGYVPVLVDGDTLVADSFAILMYLEEKYPQHPLLPLDLQKKAINYQAANIVSSSIQPLQNLAVLKYIEEKVSPDEKLEWVKVHIGKGFSALEELLNNHAGKYATGDEVYMADLFLAPQVYAAIRFQLDMTQFPLLARLHEAYKKIPAFLDAIPEKQPDAPSP